MADVGFSPVDMGILGFFLFFIVIGIVRGFTSDFLGLFTWIGAALSTKAFFPKVQPFAKEIIDSQFGADMAATFGIFLLSLIVLVSLVKVISKGVHKSILSGLDRSLGVFSGIFRSTVLLTIAYMVGLMYWKPLEKPEWINTSKFEPFLTWSARQAQIYIVPKDLIPPKIKAHLESQLVELPPIPASKLVESLSSPRPETTEESTKNQKAYEKNESQELDNLFKEQGK